MAILKLYRHKLKENYNFLQNIFEEHNIAWGVVTKMLCGNIAFLKEVINLGITEAHDSRLSNLKAIKSINPNVQTVYIKPAPSRLIPSIVKYADVSLETEFETIKLLSEEAQRQKKVHKVIIMIEMGDLREGVMGEHLIEFYENIFRLPAISVIGLGTNLNCLHGVMPSPDKLIQLSLYKQIIELKFNRKIPWISGGSSVTIPLVINNQVPPGLNHLRVGETLYFGADLFTETTIKGMHDDVFELFAEIIELHEKPMQPTGDLGHNPSGEMAEIDVKLMGKTSFRAILDIGLLDIDPKFLIPKNKNVAIVGASSDMLVIDLGRNSGKLKVGNLISFKLKYMGALHLLNSRYIDKAVE